MKKVLIVNLYGSPGAGKSTGSAYIFSQLKIKGINAELVTEFIKDKVYEQSQGVLDNQIYIFGKQYFKMTRVMKDVDVIITDAPLFIQSYYTEKYNFPYKKELKQLISKVYSMNTNMNYFVNRSKPYNPKGRFQTEEQSNQISNEMKKYLIDNSIQFKEIKGNIEDYNKVVNEILEKLK